MADVCPVERNPKRGGRAWLASTAVWVLDGSMARRGGWRRLGRERFRYVDSRGRAIESDADLERIRSLVIPRGSRSRIDSATQKLSGNITRSWRTPFVFAALSSDLG